MDIYEKSLNILKKIIQNQKKLNIKIILIGGWAVYAYNPYLKSKDIDLLIEKKNFWRLKDFLEKIGFRQTASIPLDKKGFAMLFGEDKIEIDVYDEKIVKYNVKDIFGKNRFESKKIEGRDVLIADRNLLLALKILAAKDRLGTAKGIKDYSDILALFDRFYPKLDLDYIKSQIKERELNKVFQLVFADYKKIKDIYPMSFLRYQKIKNGIFKKFILNKKKIL